MRKLAVVTLIVLLSVVLFAHAAAKPKVQIVAAKYTSPASGQEMYNAYCASCHGLNGKGTGPAASALKDRVPDLTTIKKAHGGTFPELHVVQSICGDVPLAAHGSKDMPVWGPVLSELSQRDSAKVQLRLKNITQHIETLQEE